MTNKEAIKYLQQIYPNGGHCWLDEQRIEAISMAINALQEEPVSEQNLSNVERTVKNWKEEPVSEDLEEACEQLAENARKRKAETSSPFFSQTDYRQGVIDGAQWKNEQMIANAIDGVVIFDYYDSGDKIYGCVAHDSFCLENFGLKDRDKVKVIVIKED